MGWQWDVSWEVFRDELLERVIEVGGDAASLLHRSNAQSFGTVDYFVKFGVWFHFNCSGGENFPVTAFGFSDMFCEDLSAFFVKR